MSRDDPALARLALELGASLTERRTLREYPLITTQPGSRSHELLAELRDRDYVTLARPGRSFASAWVWRVTRAGVAAARHYTEARSRAG